MEQAIVRLSHEYPKLGADKIVRLVRNENHLSSNDPVMQVRRQQRPIVPPPNKNSDDYWNSREGARRKHPIPGM